MAEEITNLFVPATLFKGKKAKIKVIGVGGGGGNAINHMVKSTLKGVDFIAVNTDAQDLSRNQAPYLAQIGEKLTRGLGVGGDPAKGRAAAEESEARLREYISPCDLLFITAGMGGGTGTGAAPYIAKLAKDMLGDNVLVVGVVTRPFNAEGYRREQFAESGIQEMQKYADTMIIIPNEKIFSAISVHTTQREAYAMVDEVLLRAVRGISEVITNEGETNIDFNDVLAVMRHSERALIGIGEASGHNRHLLAMRQAITSPLLENADVRGAKGFIVNIASCGDLAAKEHQEAMAVISEYANSDSVIKFGNSVDPALEGKVRVTVIAAGLSEENANAITIRQSRPLSERGFTKKPQSEDAFKDDKRNFGEDRLIPAILRRQPRIK